MLIDAIRRLLGSPGETTGPGQPAQPAGTAPDARATVDPLHLAACVLLLDIAYADGEFSDEERLHVEDVLARHFALGPEAGHRLMELAEAERAKAVDHFQFTSQLQQNYDTGQKMVLAEIMWGVVLADGEIAEHEQYLTRKISNLLDLEPGYLSAAKAAAARKQTDVG
jgi:uncharacterized tellurite resistance protein B-like protein